MVGMIVGKGIIIDHNAPAEGGIRICLNFSSNLISESMEFFQSNAKIIVDVLTFPNIKLLTNAIVLKIEKPYIDEGKSFPICFESNNISDVRRKAFFPVL